MRALLLKLLLIGSLLGTHQASAKIEPTPQQAEAIQSVVAALEAGHYREQAVDNRLSETLLERYIEALDPSRGYFLQSDIDQFGRYAELLDDQLMNSDLSAAYEIYNLFLTRYSERLKYLLERLNSELSYQFDGQQTLAISREEAAWFTTVEEQNDYWNKRLDSALLNLKLADRTLDEARETLIKRYSSQLHRAEQTNANDVFQTFANILANIYDPHTAYFSPQTSENFQINMSLSLEGIGAVLQTEDEFTKVVSLVPAGPADKSGQLHPADLIVGVGQGAEGPVEDVVGMRLDEVVNLIRGPKDSVVRLEIIPAGTTDRANQKVISLTRNRVQLEEQAAKSELLEINREGKPYKLGIIDIPTFYIDFAALQQGDPNYRSTTRDVAKLIDELKQQQIDGLIIDLRDNGGGSLREANELIGLFISRGPTVQIRDSAGRVDILGDYDPDTLWNGPLTVVINRLSASASEIFAGAIQDYRRGLIVGSRSFGKGTVQTLQPLEYGQVKLTTAKFYRISGESTQHQGVSPDISFPAMIDEQEIGESALDFALPWDQVRPVRFGRYTALDRWIPELRSRHVARANSDPDFQYMDAIVKRSEEQKNQKYLPLNEQALRQQRDQLEAVQLDLENKRRRAKGLGEIDHLDDLFSIDTAETESSEPPVDDNDRAVLHEAGELTIDMIEMFRLDDARRFKAANG